MHPSFIHPPVWAMHLTLRQSCQFFDGDEDAAAATAACIRAQRDDAMLSSSLGPDWAAFCH